MWSDPDNPYGYAFQGNPLDRRSEHRGDAAWVDRHRQATGARYVLFCDGRVVANVENEVPQILHPRPFVAGLNVDPEDILLGFRPPRDAPVFAVRSLFSADEIEARLPGHKCIDIRSLAIQGVVGAGDLGMVAQASSLLHWHATHRFCSRCGAASEMTQGGYRRDCPACGALHFPRTDPVAIMLITDGDQCLLGRSPRLPEHVFSTLAGFIEPGETVEEAVRREVFEEAGIHVGAVSYLASQPWPFPASLMIGCEGHATSRDITMDETELEACCWFSRDDVRAMMAGTHPHGLKVPPPLSIAYWLIRSFVERAP